MAEIARSDYPECVISIQKLLFFVMLMDWRQARELDLKAMICSLLMGAVHAMKSTIEERIIHI